jgi:hypothetical protein
MGGGGEPPAGMPPQDTSDPSAAAPAPGGPQGPPAEVPAGLSQQARRTAGAGRRLVSAHVGLARAELGEIKERAKAAAILIAIAIALALFMVVLASVGTTLFIGEWVFGSIGWGVLHGTLLCLALIVVLVLGALEIPPRHLAASLVGALAIGALAAVVLGLDWPNQLFARIGDSVSPGADASTRPLLVGLAAGAVVFGVLGFLAGARAGGIGGSLSGLVGGAVVGLAVGAFLSISFSRHVGIAIGICAMLIAWPALAATALRSFDPGALKARYWPGTTIETTKETIEWVRARTPLGKKP